MLQSETIAYTMKKQILLQHLDDYSYNTKVKLRVK